MIEIIKAIIFGIVEGITEWLPVSSTGHLILLDEFLRLDVGQGLHPDFADEFGEIFNVVIQLGAILAVLVTYWRRLIPTKKEQLSPTFRLWCKIAVASVPAAFAGIVLDKLIESLTSRDIDGWLYNAYVVAAALIIYGVLFILIERRRGDRVPMVTDLEGISYKNAFLIGIFQMLAIIPGTSRSGSTILGSMLLGLSRSTAAEFSFFMAIPAMLGAGALKAYGFFDYVGEMGITVPATAWIVLAVASAVAFVVSMIAIKFLTDFVKKHSFAPFGVYRIVLGVAVLAYFIIK